jgi:hypothetical protein
MKSVKNLLCGCFCFFSCKNEEKNDADQVENIKSKKELFEFIRILRERKEARENIAEVKIERRNSF